MPNPGIAKSGGTGAVVEDKSDAALNSVGPVKKGSLEIILGVTMGEEIRSEDLFKHPRLESLRQLYSSIIVTGVQVQVIQGKYMDFLTTLSVSKKEDMVGGALGGVIRFGLVPSMKKSMLVKGKDYFALRHLQDMTYSRVNNIMTSQLDLTGYEVDLALEPRRGAGPVLVCALADFDEAAKAFPGIVVVRAKFTVSWEASGVSTMWL